MMGDNYIHWYNNTGGPLWATAYHDLVKRRYYGVKCEAGGTGVPYKPHFQSYEYTIRWYDANDDKKVAEYQYVSVEHASYLVQINQSAAGYWLQVSQFGVQPPVSKRPFYVIAHRCNSKSRFEEALKKGANAIEFDVRYGRPNVWSEFRWYVHHDGVLEWSTTLADWLAECQAVYLNYRQQLAVLIADIKTPEHLKSLRDQIRSPLSSFADVNVIFSMPHFKDRGAFDEIINQLGPRDGLSIDMDNDPQQVQDFFASKGVNNCWYGNGIFEGGIGPNVFDSLVRAGQLRDWTGRLKKTYVWTLEKKESIENYIFNAKVDGVMVNPGDVESAKNIVNSIATTRMALPSDPAFTVYVPSMEAQTAHD